MAEIHFKTFSPLAAASASVVITAQSAPTGVARSQVVRRGAVIREVLSVQWFTCHSSPQAAGSDGEWPATTAAPAKGGALTQLLSLCANRFHVFHRLLDLDRRWLQGQLHDSRRVRIVARFCHPENRVELHLIDLSADRASRSPEHDFPLANILQGTWCGTPFTEMTPIAQSFANGAEYHA
jgi:hypothetical protein